MHVLVCGDRVWRDHELMKDALKQLPPGTVVVHGDCRGADRMAGEIAKELGFSVIACPPQWAEFGRAAGPIRNRMMIGILKRSDGEILTLGFHKNIGVSKGTINCLKQSKGAGIRTRLIEGRKDLKTPIIADGQVAAFDL